MQKNTCTVFTELKIKIKITCSFVPFAQDTQVTKLTLGGRPCLAHLAEAPLLLFWLLLLPGFSLAPPNDPSPKSLLSWPITPCTYLFHTFTLDGNHVCVSVPLVGTPVGRGDVPDPSTWPPVPGVHVAFCKVARLTYPGGSRAHSRARLSWSSLAAKEDSFWT